jgi:hypothetical protein
MAEVARVRADVVAATATAMEVSQSAREAAATEAGGGVYIDHTLPYGHFGFVAFVYTCDGRRCCLVSSWRGLFATITPSHGQHGGHHCCSSRSCVRVGGSELSLSR